VVIGTDLFATKDIEFPNSFVERLNDGRGRAARLFC
jgi:hypothetical protein